MKKRIGMSLIILGIISALAYALRPMRIVSTNSGEAYEEYCRGIERLYKFYFEEALTHFEKAVELDTGFAMAHCRRGCVLASLGRIEKAKLALAKAVELAPKTTEKEQLIIAFHNAAVHCDGVQINEIMEHLVQRYPKAIEPYDFRGGEYSYQRRYQEAINEYKRILEIDPNYALAYNKLGYAYAYLGNFDEAVTNLKKYVFLAPDQPNPHDSLGEIYLYMGRYDEAITEFNRSRQLKPDFTYATDHLGVVYRHKGMYRKAIGYFEKSLSVNTGQSFQINNLIEIARTYYEIGDYDQSLAVLEEITADSRQLVKVNWLIGLNYIEKGAIDRATSRKEQIKDLWSAKCEEEGIDGNDEEMSSSWEIKFFHDLSGRIEVARGVYDKAIENFENALYCCSAIPPEEVFARTVLAETLFKNGETEEAIAELGEALKINPNYYPSRYLLARIYDEQGDLHQARTEMEKYLMIMDGCDEGIGKVEEIKKRLAELQKALSEVRTLVE